MKQVLRERFEAALVSWDKKHRLVGRTPVSTLFKQSLEALRSSWPSARRGMVDIGAGSGILGFPGLFEGIVDKVAFVEPDLKKTAFIRSVILELRDIDPGLRSRVLIIEQPVESVSRETLDHFFQSDQFAYAARAFSGPKTLLEALGQSFLPKPLKVLNFSIAGTSPDEKFVLEELTVN